MTETKARLYKTATATIGCAYFKAGDIVAVDHQRVENGCHWFKVTLKGQSTYYPEHHLTRFVL